MLKTRVIPCLLLKHQGLVKTVRFQAPKYLGDPINIVKLFNDKEVDELIFLDITATIEHRPPPFDLLSKITSECFMPLGYGGGVRTLEDMRRLYSLGIEKVVVNSYAVENPSFIRAAAEAFGSQSVVVSLEAKKNVRGKYQAVTHSGHKTTGGDPVRFAEDMQRQGAGEILLNSVDRDGTQQGYDLELIRQVTRAVDIPVVACGGAGSLKDMVAAVRQGGASAAAAGSLFVFQGPLRAVLISYPAYQDIRAAFDAADGFVPSRFDTEQAVR